MTSISIELIDALDAAQAECMTAAQKGNPDMVEERISKAFAKLYEEVKKEPHRVLLTEWRQAVAIGKTTLGFDEWKKGESA